MGYPGFVGSWAHSTEHESFCSFVVLGKKKDSTIRICIDYSDLNKKTLKNKYPILRIDELMDEFERSTVLLKE